MKIYISLIICFLAASTLIAGEEVSGTLKQAKIDADRESALDTIAYINQMNYAYTVMQTYHNIVAVQDEYEKISIDRIDVSRIPSFSYNSKAMLDLIKDMLDTLETLKMNEEDYKFYQEKLEDSRRRAKKEMWLKIITFVPEAIKGTADVIKKGAEQGENGYVVAGKAALVLAGDLVGSPLRAVMDYDKTLDELRGATSDSRFKYERSKEENAHNANKKLLEAEHQFVKDKNLKSEDILTPNELKSLVEALKNGKSERVFKLLDTSEMRTRFRRFAPYWYYLASFAVDNKKWDVAIEASDNFFEEYRGLVKVDPMVAQVALANVAALVAICSKDHEKIRGLLKKICEVNYNNANPDFSYFCAEVFYHVLNDPKAALQILGTANAKIEGDYEARLVTYRNKYTEEEIALKEDELPKDTDLIRIRTLYNDILLERKSADLSKNVLDICKNQTASSLEKLFYIGRVRVDDLWEEAKDDVLAIKVRYVRPRLRHNRFTVELPISWFLLGEVESNIVLCKGKNDFATIDEDKGNRKIRKSETGIGNDIVTLTFYCPSSKLPGVDSVRLQFPHKSWPIDITYKPSLLFHIRTGEDGTRDTEYIPVKIKFMGVEKALVNPSNDIEDNILTDKLKHYSHFLIPFRFGTTAYCTNFLTAIEIGTGRNFNVAYTNPTPYKTHIDLDVRYYNEYGALLCDVKETEEIIAHGGGKWTLDWPSDMKDSEVPAYALFQYHVDDTVFDWWKNYLKRREEEKSKKKLEELGDLYD